MTNIFTVLINDYSFIHIYVIVKKRVASSVRLFNRHKILQPLSLPAVVIFMNKYFKKLQW